jgi:hypothetical protein
MRSYYLGVLIWGTIWPITLKKKSGISISSSIKERQLVRIQCKTARVSSDKGFLKFNTSTASMGGAGVWKKRKSGYRGRADWFGVYSPDTGKVYMVSVWEAPASFEMRLRLLPSRNNQGQGVKWAKDYEI